MGTAREWINGIDAVTGKPLPPAMDDEDILRNPRDIRLSDETYEEYQWWRENFSDPERGPAAHVDPRDLASAGWAVIFGPDVDQDTIDLLQPLLELRKEQATRRCETYYREYRYGGESKHDFLAKNGASWGVADPKDIPYYLLLVGDPKELPFHFQYDVDIQYAVGRLNFKNVEDYGKYAQNVVAADQAAVELPQRVVFFGVEPEHDDTSHRIMQELVRPLAGTIEERADNDFKIHFEDRAERGQLRKLLGSGQKPALLFTAAHGMRFSADYPHQLSYQGALLCADWSGAGPILREHYFAGEDIPDVDLEGLVACLFGCYSAGTPEMDNFSTASLGEPQRIADRPFISDLAQSLLTHGASAVLGHIDRAWTTSFTWSDKSGDQTKIFESTLIRLLERFPVGFAMEYINQRYAELATALTDIFIMRETGHPLAQGKSHIKRVLKAMSDARNFIVVGDPAVCLRGTRALSATDPSSSDAL